MWPLLVSAVEAVSFSRSGSRTKLAQYLFHCVLLVQQSQIEGEETELQLPMGGMLTSLELITSGSWEGLKIPVE